MKNDAPEPARLDARLNAALRRLPDAPVPSNFTARVLDAIEREESHSARVRGWNWRFLFPRVAVAAAVLVFAGTSIERYEVHSHRVALAKNLVLVASAQSPGVDALVNLDTIQGMSQSGHADNDLLAALQ
jgi:anti-sigma factor RsiW